MRLISAIVIDITEASNKHQKLQVKYCEIDKQNKEIAAINYLDLAPTYKVGDQVLINVTGIDLNLGTGGLAFVVPAQPLDYSRSSTGHIIKLRYTPLQREYCTIEEQASTFHDLLKDADSINFMPVVCCELHSQIPLVAAGIKNYEPQANIVYCMTDQAALPLALSDLVRAAQAAGLIDTTITCGQSFGGDYEAINLYSGLLAAKHAIKANVAIVAIGPGIPGSGTRFGHGGVAQGEALNAVSALGGIPIAALRISFADQRDRHYGLSHHSLTMLKSVCQTKVDAIIPEDLEPWQLDAVYTAIEDAHINDKHSYIHFDPQANKIDLRGVEVTTMGRNQHQDPVFFSAAFAAGIWAGRELQRFGLGYGYS